MAEGEEMKTDVSYHVFSQVKGEANRAKERLTACAIEINTLRNDLDRTRKELEEAKPYMDAIRQRHNGYCPEMRKIGIKEPKSPKAALDSLIGEAEALGLAESKEYRKELDRWKTMAQRHNPSGCCCQIDENNGDPKMVEPCAFHAEWRDTVLEALRGKVQGFKSVINSLGGITTLNIDLLEAYRGLCAASQLYNSADSNERPDPGMNIYYKNRTIANTEKVATESVTQPRINFCYACGTALGCTD